MSLFIKIPFVKGLGILWNIVRMEKIYKTFEHVFRIFHASLEMSSSALPKTKKK